MRSLAILLMFLASSAQAEFANGNELQQNCKTAENSCAAYILGVFDAFTTVSNGTGKFAISRENGAGLEVSFGCMPEGVTGQQIIDIVKKYLNDHPEFRHFPAPGIIQQAIVSAFPCD